MNRRTEVALGLCLNLLVIIVLATQRIGSPEFWFNSVENRMVLIFVAVGLFIAGIIGARALDEI